MLYEQELTDESFAFHSVKLGKGAPVNVRYLIGFNLYCHTSWVLGGLVGAICAQYAAHLIKYQLDYALSNTFFFFFFFFFFLGGGGGFFFFFFFFFFFLCFVFFCCCCLVERIAG